MSQLCNTRFILEYLEIKKLIQKIKLRNHFFSNYKKIKNHQIMKVNESNFNEILNNSRDEDIIRYKQIAFSISKTTGYITLTLIVHPIFYLFVFILCFALVLALYTFIALFFNAKEVIYIGLLSVLIVVFFAKKISKYIFDLVFARQINNFRSFVSDNFDKTNNRNIFINTKDFNSGWAKLSR